ncbi:hypothetical protein WJX81_000474 [Elliptochloris bilobata]|uniref:Uncharacterized protein n=1 Tax=Elliptochloris bilobata TaxID=381761 RepID=A0AAW1QKG2_9CHLO
MKYIWCLLLACAAVSQAATSRAAAARRALHASEALSPGPGSSAPLSGHADAPAAAVAGAEADAASTQTGAGGRDAGHSGLFDYKQMGAALAQLILLQESTADKADKGLFALMNHTAYELARLTGPPPQPPQNTTLVRFRPPVLVYNSTDMGTMTLDVAANLAERAKTTAAKATAAAQSGGGSGLFDFLGGLLRGNSSDAVAEKPGSDALLHGAQNLLGNDTLNTLGAAVFPFILVAPIGINYAKAAVLIMPRAGLVAPVLFNIQDSLLHVEALAMDVSPRLINIEPTLIRLGGALAALGGREGVVNIAPSLISMAGAVTNVVPGKACNSVKVDPDLIKIQGAGNLVIDRGPKQQKSVLHGPISSTTIKGQDVGGGPMGGAGGAGGSGGVLGGGGGSAMGGGGVGMGSILDFAKQVISDDASG